MTLPLMEPGSLAQWMSQQRWYANKGALPQLEEIGRVRWSHPDSDVEIVTHLLLDHTEGKPGLYQVPLSYRGEPLADASALVGLTAGRWVYDGPHDPAYAAALLAQLGSSRVDGDDMWSAGHDSEPAASVAVQVSASHVLTAEQSNTSIIISREHGMPLIGKVFRALHHGENPDVELQTALAAAGFASVPRSAGNVTAEWNDRGRSSGRALGHLAFVQEFLEGATDGWKVAVAAAQEGRDFSESAHNLGIAIAHMHGTLASTFPREATTPADAASVIDQMCARLVTAIDAVPSLAQHHTALRDLLEAAGTERWPHQQRIHGDLHLGQVLDVPGRPWVIVDFEGEPLRPMHERSKLDSPLRDIASMLRSFDYVGGAVAVADPGRDPAEIRQWVAAARAAFTNGYSAASGHDMNDDRVILDAFEVDKALYETVYEVRNRPDWLPIPLAAIDRLVGRAVQG